MVLTGTEWYNRKDFILTKLVVVISATFCIVFKCKMRYFCVMLAYPRPATKGPTLTKGPKL